MGTEKDHNGKTRSTAAADDSLSRRLASVRETMVLEDDRTPEEIRRILESRAKDLARVPVDEEDGDSLKLVEFLLAHERYGIELAYISEIHPLTDLTPIPCAPAFVLGIVNLRSRIISVLDLKKFFELPEQGLSNLSRLLVLQSPEMQFGILADRVLGSVTVPVKDIQPPLPTLTEIGTEYFKGITGDELIILDGRKLLADKKIIVNQG